MLLKTDIEIRLEDDDEMSQPPQPSGQTGISILCLWWWSLALRPNFVALALKAKFSLALKAKSLALKSLALKAKDLALSDVALLCVKQGVVHSQFQGCLDFSRIQFRLTRYDMAPCLSACLSQAGVLSKRMNGSWIKPVFGTEATLGLSYNVLKGKSGISKIIIGLLPSGTVNLTDFYRPH